MAKSSGGAGRGGGRARPAGQWTTSVWDAKTPGRAKPEARSAARPQQTRRNAQGGVAIQGDYGYGRSVRPVMRDLQRQIRGLATQRGIKYDSPIPGLNGLTIKNLTTNAASRAPREAELRAALAWLQRNR